MGEPTLKIKEVTQDPTDPQKLRFILQFTRDLTATEREIVPQAIAKHMGLPTAAHGPDTVVIGLASVGWFNQARHRKTLKAAVAEGEALAERFLAERGSVEGRAAALADQTARELAEIDWDDGDSEPPAEGYT